MDKKTEWKQHNSIDNTCLGLWLKTVQKFKINSEVSHSSLPVTKMKICKHRKASREAMSIDSVSIQKSVWQWIPQKNWCAKKM